MKRAAILLATVAVAATSAPEIHAQQGVPPAQIKRVRTSSAKTPKYNISGGQGLRPRSNRDWMLIRVEYETLPEWTDGLVLRAYVGGLSRMGPVVLTGEVEYQNVEKGSHDAVLLVHPNAVKRYGDGFDDETVTVELVVGGMVVDRTGPKGRVAQPWWQGAPAVAGQVLGRDQTPFAMLDDDAYEQIKR